jgi:hypothetical protein
VGCRERRAEQLERLLLVLGRAAAAEDRHEGLGSDEDREQRCERGERDVARAGGRSGLDVRRRRRRDQVDATGKGHARGPVASRSDLDRRRRAARCAHDLERAERSGGHTVIACDEQRRATPRWGGRA